MKQEMVDRINPEMVKGSLESHLTGCTGPEGQNRDDLAARLCGAIQQHHARSEQRGR